MNNKLRNIFVVLIVFLLIALVPQNVYADDPKKDNHDVYHQVQKEKSGSDVSWVTDAFKAAKSFLSESEVEDELGVLEPWMLVFSDIVKAINRVFIIILAGLSIISLSIVGIRYIMSSYKPTEKGKAQQDMHLVFKGMFYGFGAFAIWRIAISIINLIIGSF